VKLKLEKALEGRKSRPTYFFFLINFYFLGEVFSKVLKLFALELFVDSSILLLTFLFMNVFWGKGPLIFVLTNVKEIKEEEMGNEK
jgi:glucan phosphoethanolaminetransferase (alkaline phosphatase superfamily)